MKLYYSPGACSLSPHIVLREAGRRFDLERVDLKSHRTASGVDYLAVNPKGYVPALQLDGPGSPILTEGPAIVQYIADLAPDARLVPPNGTFARYHLQEWLGFLTTEVHKMFRWLGRPDTPAHTQARPPPQALLDDTQNSATAAARQPGEPQRRYRCPCSPPYVLEIAE